MYKPKTKQLPRSWKVARKRTKQGDDVEKGTSSVALVNLSLFRGKTTDMYSSSLFQVCRILTFVSRVECRATGQRIIVSGPTSSRQDLGLGPESDRVRLWDTAPNVQVWQPCSRHGLACCRNTGRTISHLIILAQKHNKAS